MNKFRDWSGKFVSLVSFEHGQFVRHNIAYARLRRFASVILGLFAYPISNINAAHILDLRKTNERSQLASAG